MFEGNKSIETKTEKLNLNNTKPKDNSFFTNNILHPLLNSAVITPVDIAENMANAVSKTLDHKDILPVTPEYKIQAQKPYSASWLAQNVASGIGMAVPFVVAGLATHEALATGADTLGLKTEVSAILKSQSTAMIAGSGLVGYFGPLQAGQTRIGNAAANLASFSVFMGGNSLVKDLPLSSRLIANAPIGAIGAITGLASQSLITQDKLPNANEILSAGITGATLNTLLPAVQELGFKGIESVKNNFQLKSATANSTDLANSAEFANISKIALIPKNFEITSPNPYPYIADAKLDFQNPDVEGLAKTSYDKASLDKITNFLSKNKTIELRRYSSGGQSAVTVIDEPSLESAAGGLLILQWDRDNIMQALSEYQAKFNPDLNALHIVDDNAWKNGLASSLKYQMTHQYRLLDIIDGKASGFDIGARPHIRYNGVSLEDVGDPWGNAQNDALASINYLLFHAINEGHLKIDDPAIAPFAKDYAAILPNYFKTIHAWEDWDFGAWEDKRAEHASSIGMALASLREQKTYVDKNGPLSYEYNGKTYAVNSNDLEGLISNCENKLKTLLPNEFVRSDDGSIRNVDAALINPLYLSALSHQPLLDDAMNTTIIKNIEGQLMGDIGVRRYPGDVWDGRTNRTELPSDMAAQWTHVSPMISAVLSDMYDRTQNPEFLNGQIFHFNRALTGIDSDWKLPEAYIRNADNTQWIADANKPLAWSQSSTLAALSAMYKRVH